MENIDKNARGKHFMHFFSFYIITNGRNEEGAYCDQLDQWYELMAK